MSGPTVQLDHDPPASVAHVAVPAPAARSVGQVALPTREAVRTFDVPEVPSLESGEDAGPHFRRQLGDEASPSQPLATASSQAQARRSGEPALTGAQDHVDDGVLGAGGIGEIEHGVLEPGLRR
jgi:hypothetical protein